MIFCKYNTIIIDLLNYLDYQDSHNDHRGYILFSKKYQYYKVYTHIYNVDRLTINTYLEVINILLNDNKDTL